MTAGSLTLDAVTIKRTRSKVDLNSSLILMERPFCQISLRKVMKRKVLLPLIITMMPRSLARMLRMMKMQERC